ncbi:hypothetical protein SS05631_c30800 [Sinorhizobium sp. CCBAU 05631]|nr:hypothetical protein SS05631_c30800 [Sinorhizobium sp. CCBAU 05631]
MLQCHSASRRHPARPCRNSLRCKRFAAFLRPIRHSLYRRDQGLDSACARRR